MQHRCDFLLWFMACNQHFWIVTLLSFTDSGVYDVCSTNHATLDTFSYAVQKGIEIVIPDNTLKSRNIELYRKSHNPRKAVEK